jgi:hypothetical protein
MNCPMSRKENFRDNPFVKIRFNSSSITSRGFYRRMQRHLTPGYRPIANPVPRTLDQATGSEGMRNPRWYAIARRLLDPACTATR